MTSSHDYKDGVCECGAEKHDHNWKLTASGNEITLSCTGTGTCDVTDKGKLTITAAGGTYDGNAKAANVSVTGYMKNNGTVSSVKYYEEGAHYALSSAPKNAGKYTAEVTCSLGYSLSATAKVEFTISKANATVTATGYEGTYDGNAHGITVNAPAGLKVTYNGGYSSAPTYTDAGTYTVTYEVENNSNYNITGRTGSADVKINPVEVTVTAAGYEGTYDGNEHGITVNVPDGLSVYYSEKESGSYYYTSSPTYKNSGEYTVYYKVETDKNHKVTNATGSAVVQIKPVEVTVTATGYEGTYDGNAHGITVNVPDGLSVYYSEKENGSYYYTSSPTYKNSGEYTVYYKVETDKNHKVTNATGSATVKINQADLQLAVTAEKYEGVYDGKSHGIKVTAPEDVTIEYSTDGVKWGSWYNDFKDVCDKTTVYYRAKANYNKENYTTTEASGSSTVEIKPLDLKTVLNVTAEDTTFTYNRYDHTDDGTYTMHSIKLAVDKTQVPGTYDSVTIEYSKDGGTTWSTLNPSFTNVGVYPVLYRIYVKDYNMADGKNANYIGIEGTKKVTINKADLPFDELHGYEGPYDGYYHYIFGHVKYTDSGWGYTYWTSYWWLDDLTYEFSWTDDNGVAHTSTVTGKDNFISYYDGKVPAFKKQNVSSISGSEPGKKVTVTISGDNYNTKTFTYNVKIGPGYALADSYEGTYDGDAHTILNYVPRGTKMEYREEGNTEWLPASQEPSRTDVGVTSVEWKASFDSDGDGKIGGYDANGKEDKDGIYNTFGSKEVLVSKKANTITVNPASLTATANDKTITYGDAPSDNGVTITGTYYGSDTEAVVDKSGLDYDHTYAQFGDVGTYDITPKGLSATNYTFTYVAGKLTVQQKPVTILIDDSVATASGEQQVPQLKVDPDDLVNNDTCTVVKVEYYNGNTKLDAAPTAPGSYTIKIIELSNNNYYPENDVEFTIRKSGDEAPVEFTVKYDANGGSGAMDEDTVESGSKYTLLANKFKAPSGKTFKCWKIGNKEYNPGDKITVEGDVTVKAVWKAKSTADLDYVPASGDNAPMFLWMFLLLSGAVALVEYAVRRKRR